MRDLRPILLVEDSPKDAELTMADCHAASC